MQQYRSTLVRNSVSVSKMSKIRCKSQLAWIGWSRRMVTQGVLDLLTYLYGLVFLMIWFGNGSWLMDGCDCKDVGGRSHEGLDFAKYILHQFAQLYYSLCVHSKKMSIGKKYTWFYPSFYPQTFYRSSS